MTWDAYTGVEATAYYRILRDGVEIGQALPRRKYAVGAAGFTDYYVVRGQTYQYQVQAVDIQGATSAPSNSVAATRPTSGFPVPAISIDASEARHTVRLLAKGASVLQTWYPKIADMIAGDGYTPASQLVIAVVVDRPPGYPSDGPGRCLAAGWAAGGNTLYICDSEYEEGEDEVNTGLFVHEATHILQNYHPGATRAVDEGIATWAGDLSQGIWQAPSFANISYLNGYEFAAGFYRWIQEHYDPSFVRDMNVRAHYGAFEYSWYKLETGKEVHELWAEMTGVRLTRPYYLKTSSNLCASLEGNAKTPLRLAPCREQDDAKYFVYDPSRKRLYADAHCMTLSDDGVVVRDICGTRDVTSAAQQWEHVGGSWKSRKNAQCLQPQGGALVAGAQLETAPCNASLISQKWTSPG